LAGRLEMCYQNAWGTVCSDGYSSQEAAVACRQLGFSDAGQYTLIFLYIDKGIKAGALFS